ncbi:hypothetical protein BA6E_11015 [Bacteroidales bacterium 6E]|nr:hypothetical protein BA6E_11015 [Bacteroidales bacterium 6E]
MNRIYFKEEQRFTQWWVWLLLLFATAVSVGPLWYGVYSQLSTGIPWGDNPTSDDMLVVIAIVMTLFMATVVILFRIQKLELVVSDQDVSFRFLPFIRKWIRITPGEIKSWEVITYNPIRTYGGRGIKRRNKNDRAYNVSGNLGLRIHLVNGKMILIGTQRRDALIHAMAKMAGQGNE